MKKTVTIYIDATGFQNFQTGVGRYSYNLITHILSIESQWHFVVLVSHRLDDSHPVYTLAHSHANMRVRKINVSAIGPTRDMRFLFPIGRYDIYHCLNSNLPLRIGRGSIVTVHDIIYFHYPQFLGALYRLKLKYYNLLMRHIATHAERIIAVSHATAQDFAAHYASDKRRRQVSEKTVIIHEGVTTMADFEDNGDSHDHAISRYRNRATPYFLHIGELRPHKNIDRLMEGFDLFRSMTRGAENTKLYIVGSHHAGYTFPPSLPKHVEHLGAINNDQELTQLYHHAIGLCYVSLCEGFGLPILEAMQHRVAVITSNRSSMPEVAGDAALLVDPASSTEIAQAMKALYTSPDLRSQLITKGIANVQRFSWHKTASETCRLYQDLLQKQKA